MINTLIFDFNGTMFFDGQIQKISWKEFLKQKFNREMTEKEFEKHIAGRNNRYTFEFYTGRHLSTSELNEFTDEKEKLYCDYCLEHPQDFHLVEGLPNFLDQCISNDIKLNIATASELPNMQFFFNHLDLNKWFDINKVSLNDNTLPGKPAPDMFIRAINNVQSTPEESAIFEDSVSGILSANNANAGEIILVEDVNLNPVNLPNTLRVDKIIHDYNDFKKIVPIIE